MSMIPRQYRQTNLKDYYQTAKAVYQGGQQAGKVLRKAYDWSKARRTRRRISTSRYGSSLKRKIGGSRTLKPIRSKAMITRNTQGEQSGGYTQWESTKGTGTLSKKMSLVSQMNRILKLNQEKLIFRWNGVKNFDDNGYYWLQNRDVVDRRYMPLYAFDLTSCINQRDNSIVSAQPMYRGYMANGAVGFEVANHYDSDGVTQVNELKLEQASYSQNGTVATVLPHNKDILKWLAISINAWGCKSRSTKFTMQIVRFKEDDLIPTDIQAANERRTALFQNIIKPYMFNPISTTATQLKKYFKVLKSETFMIQPTSTTETDQDPHVRTVKWFIRMNRMLDYVQRANNIIGSANVADQADFVVNLGQQNDCYVKPDQRLFLMIYATNYGTDIIESNTDTPSFDLNVRMCHQTVA